jgi:hypothetical protein
MPGHLDHSPARIIQALLIREGLGVEPAVAPDVVQDWSIYYSVAPGSPDKVISVYNTEGIGHGRSMPDGRREQHEGINVAVRAPTHDVGYLKAKTIATAMDQTILQEQVTIEDSTYRVHSFTRTSDVIDLGKELPESRRNLFTINALVVIEKV